MWKEMFLLEEWRRNVAINLCETIVLCVNFDGAAV